ESLSFRRVKSEVRKKLFKDGHSPASTLFAYKDKLYLNATNDQELLEILSDRAFNPDYDTVLHFSRKYRKTALGGRNGNRCLSA
ncbi:1810_t:CDS:1, partial [Paraglomus brasilianum]